MLFKINGERNSGTNFLYSLLEKNGYNIYSQKIKGNIVYYWKHGIPYNSIKKKDKRVVDIFIFRNLNDWLVSCWKNPYHLQKINKLKNFIEEKQKSNENRLLNFRTKTCLNEDDNGKTIFEIRYYKFNKIIEYKNRNKDIIFINLEYLQNEDNCLEFLKTIHSKYYYEPKDNFITKIKKHSKSKKENVKNRYSNIILNPKKIKQFINQEIEDYINNLTFEIK